MLYFGFRRCPSRLLFLFVFCDCCNAFLLGATRFVSLTVTAHRLRIRFPQRIRNRIQISQRALYSITFVLLVVTILCSCPAPRRATRATCCCRPVTAAFPTRRRAQRGECL